MKRLFVSLICALCFSVAAHAQNEFLGNWQGSLNIVSTEMRLVFHIKMSAEDTLYALMDSPDQGAKDIAVTSVATKGDSIVIRMDNIKGAYYGRRSDSATITGVWIQANHKFPLDMVKVYETPEVAVVKKSSRPQTPQPPFSYKSEDVTYKNTNKSIEFGATITIPHGKGPFPAALLITGSGQENRDEELFGHKPFAVIADYLTKNGYIVLRVDDRGVGQTTGSAENATSADFVKDAEAGLNYLKTRPEVDKKKMGLIGHSEGGMIAQMLASKRKDVDFVIFLAAPGVKTTQLMEEQNAAVMSSMGISKEVITKYKPLYSSIARDIIRAEDSAAAYKSIKKDVEDWLKRTDSTTIVTTTNIVDTASKEAFIEAGMNSYNNKWYRYFLAYDPREYLQEMNCYVLALNGEKDIQVVSKLNLNGIRMGLAKSKSKAVVTKEMPGLNHLFQTCTTCTVTEYAQLEETFSPAVLDVIGKWMIKYVSDN